METIRNPILKPKSFYGMLSLSKKMFAFFDLVERVAQTDSPVLLRGETGTGKEMVARAIHRLGSRQSGPFNAVNCAMLSPELANSELFGHVKGSFTGAVSNHIGFFEASNKGTLFLDEIAELPLNAQGRLLRVLQEKTFTKLGSTQGQKTDVRLLSATHKALRRETMLGTFREDLMYRIRVVPLFLPRLVERGKDIEMLTWHFIEEFNAMKGRQIRAISKDAFEAMHSYTWPGNIRELRNNIEYAFAVGVGDTLDLTDLTPELRGEEPPEYHYQHPNSSVASLSSAAEIDFRSKERTQILLALTESGGNRGKAAKKLNMDRSTLWRKMKSLGLS